MFFPEVRSLELSSCVFMYSITTLHSVTSTSSISTVTSPSTSFPVASTEAEDEIPPPPPPADDNNKAEKDKAAVKSMSMKARASSQADKVEPPISRGVSGLSVSRALTKNVLSDIDLLLCIKKS